MSFIIPELHNVQKTGLFSEISKVIQKVLQLLKCIRRSVIWSVLLRSAYFRPGRGWGQSFGLPSLYCVGVCKLHLRSCIVSSLAICVHNSSLLVNLLRYKTS